MKIAMACDHGGLRLKNVLKDNNMLANNTLKIEYYYSGKLVKDDKNLNELLQMTK